ncbi:MAG: 50S ribosomal protein L11 methyltransferase [Actinomycetota bacterium]|nr:50S ribosomal protein L11 methyltransferase [Actinomycetota bacterium]
MAGGVDGARGGELPRPAAAGDVVREDVELAGGPIRLRRPRSPDAILDELVAMDITDDARLPFWAELWPSGVMLARAVEAHRPLGKRVLELGCGLGLVAIAAARAGADVVATDHSPEAIDATAANAAVNEVALRAEIMDFADPGLALDGRPWDLVLAADVLYEPLNEEPLVALVPELVAGGAELWLADPGRPMLGTLLHELRRRDLTANPMDLSALGATGPLTRVSIHRIAGP